MEYIAINEAADRWEVSEQMVRKYCREKRIPKAYQIEGIWYIPADAEKPKRKTKRSAERPKLLKKLINMAKSLGYGISTLKRTDEINIYIPDATQFEALKKSVCIDNETIDCLIPDESIRKLIFSDFCEGDLSNALDQNNQMFYSAPFLKARGAGIIVLNPSILVWIFGFHDCGNINAINLLNQCPIKVF